jgi:hypothetical protein
MTRGAHFTRPAIETQPVPWAWAATTAHERVQERRKYARMHQVRAYLLLHITMYILKSIDSSKIDEPDQPQHHLPRRRNCHPTATSHIYLAMHASPKPNVSLPNAPQAGIDA